MDGVWEAVRTRTDYAALVPRPRTDIERADLRKRDGTPYTVLKNPAGDSGAGTYVRLEGPDVELYELMDGRRTTSEIIVAYLERKGVFALDRLARLTAALGVNGFFGEQRLDAYRRPRIRRARRDPIVRMSGWLRRLVVWNIATWNNAEGFVDVLKSAETLSHSAHRLVAGRKAMAQEFSQADVAAHFKANGTLVPADADYHALMQGGFKDWRGLSRVLRRWLATQDPHTTPDSSGEDHG